MPVSPNCLIAINAGPFVGTPNGVDVSPGDTISVRLADTTDVSQWYLLVLGTDELTTAPILTGVNIVTNEVATPGTVVTFTFPNFRGRSLRFQSTTQGIGGPSSTTFGFYSLTLPGRRVGSIGEQREGNTNFGWIVLVNPILREGAGILPYDDAVTLPATGAITIQQAIDYLKTHSAGTPGSTTSDALVWTGLTYAPRQLTEDDILPGFNISSFSGGGLVELGATVATPSFTASYASVPDVGANSVVLTDTDATPPKDVTSTPTSFASSGTFTKLTYGNSITFTLTAHKGAVTRTAMTTTLWAQKVFWGVSSSGGPYNAAFIAGLTNSALATSRATSFTLTPGITDKIYYAFRSAYGTPTFNVGGFDGGFELIASAVSVTNAHGVTENYDVWRSVQANLGNTTVTVS
jgi:hypothetical protein